MKDDDDVKEEVMEDDVVEEGGETEILDELVKRMNEIEKLTEAFGWALEKYIRAGLKRLYNWSALL